MGASKRFDNIRGVGPRRPGSIDEWRTGEGPAPMSVGMETAEAGLLAQMTPILLALADDGRAAVSLGGSRAKKLADANSDYDFRVYADRF
jgi:hypothetical protein